MEMSNTIYDEKMIATEAKEIVAKSNEHGQYMAERLGRQFAYVFRSGRLEHLSEIWAGMENGADLAWLSNLLTRLNRGLFQAVKGKLDPDDVRDIIATGNVNEKGHLPLFDGKSKEKIVWVKPDVEQGAKSGQQIFRRAIKELFDNDVELSETFTPFFVEENDAGKKRATDNFEPSAYLKRVIKTLETKVENPDQAGALARAVNKVVIDFFGKAKAFSASEIAAAIKERESKELSEDEKALERMKAKGYKFEAPAPHVVVDGDVVKPEAQPGDNAKDITPKAIEHKSNDPRKAGKAA
jgi:hypothetical protein